MKDEDFFNQIFTIETLMFQYRVDEAERTIHNLEKNPDILPSHVVKTLIVKINIWGTQPKSMG